MAVAGEPTLLAALAMGLFGSSHCVAMCGGISCALTMGLPEEVRLSPVRMLSYVFSYNSGRIVSYTGAGVVFGLVGERAAQWLPTQAVQSVGVVLSAGFLIALGLYLGGWWHGLRGLERIGARLWRYLEPLGRRLLPVRQCRQAFAVGLVWGWLPCGLVYAALAFALVSGSALDGGLTMLVFGLGTLPALVALGFAGRWLSLMARRGSVRRAAGVCLCLLGALALVWGIGHEQGHLLVTDAG